MHTIFDYKFRRANLQKSKQFFIFKNNEIIFENDVNFLHYYMASSLLDSVKKLPQERFKRALILSDRLLDNEKEEMGLLHAMLKAENIADEIVEYSSLLFNNDDIIQLPPDKSFDLIISNVSMQYLNDLPQILLQLKILSGNKGFVMFNCFGADSFYELRYALRKTDEYYNSYSQRIMPTIKLESLSGLLAQAGFKNIITDSENLLLEYNNVRDLLIDIKRTGEVNSLVKRVKKLTPRDYFDKLEEFYSQHNDNKTDAFKTIKNNVEIITASAW